MASLKIQEGTKREAKGGSVEIAGSCIVLRGPNSSKNRLLFAYCLKPGEMVEMTGEGDYVVQY
jgi:hypothetical protein